MPKGEHFKKPNPRIIQISFKVNGLELEKLNKVSASKNLSIPDWIRSQIEKESGSKKEKEIDVKKEKEILVKKEKEIIIKKEPAVKKEETPVAGNGQNQMSLF